MEVSGPAKPIGSFLMEMMAIPRISQSDVVEFCVATICNSWCFPVALREPFLLSAQGRLPHSPSCVGTGCSPHPYSPGISLRWDQREDGRRWERAEPEGVHQRKSDVPSQPPHALTMPGLQGREPHCHTGAFTEMTPVPIRKSPPDLFLQMKHHFGSNTTFLVLLRPCEQGIEALAASRADAGGRAAFIPAFSLSPS